MKSPKTRTKAKKKKIEDLATEYFSYKRASSRVVHNNSDLLKVSLVLKEQEGLFRTFEEFFIIGVDPKLLTLDELEEASTIEP